MATHNYPLRVRENILPLSVSDNLPEAFAEWFFTEETQDHEEPIATCELCDQEELPYHFQIRNRLTRHELWVGSKCILKFGLSVYDSGILLTEKQAKKKLDQITKKMQRESCIKALTVLSEAENNDILKNALSFYTKNKCLTPKFAFVLFWKLNKHGIDYHPSFFKINLKKQKYKDDLGNTESARVHMFWRALTTNQKGMAMRLGHPAPGE